MKQQRGFTLIEIMIVVAILAIIGSIAVSSFSNAGADARRSRAMADIAALNDLVGRYYQTAFTYAGADADFVGLYRAAGLSPGSDYAYSLTVSLDGQGYWLQATPSNAGSQAGDGALGMDERGRRCFFPGVDAPTSSDKAACPHNF